MRTMCASNKQDRNGKINFWSVVRASKEGEPTVEKFHAAMVDFLLLIIEVKHLAPMHLLQLNIITLNQNEALKVHFYH